MTLDGVELVAVREPLGGDGGDVSIEAGRSFVLVGTEGRGKSKLLEKKSECCGARMSCRGAVDVILMRDR